MKVIFSDFDGTITDDEKIPKDFFSLIELCESLSTPLVIVSGRPASWGNFLMNYFDIDSCIMEDGSISILKKDSKIFRKALLSDQEAKDILNLKNWCLKTNHDLIYSNDSVDRSYSFGLLLDSINGNFLSKLKLKIQEMNLRSYETSQYLYILPGSTDKWTAVSEYIKDKGINLKDVIFFGDSINDCSLFQHLPNTVGVSNVHKNIHKLQALPKVILEGKENRSVYGILNYLKNQTSVHINTCNDNLKK